MTKGSDFGKRLTISVGSDENYVTVPGYAKITLCTVDYMHSIASCFPDINNDVREVFQYCKVPISILKFTLQQS